MFSNHFTPKLCFPFYCKFCDYGTSKKSSINNHYTSAKHQKAMNVNGPVNPELCSTLSYECQICNKTYKDNSGLWRHKKKCQEIAELLSAHEASPVVEFAHFLEALEVRVSQ